MTGHETPSSIDPRTAGAVEVSPHPHLPFVGLVISRLEELGITNPPASGPYLDKFLRAVATNPESGVTMVGVTAMLDNPLNSLRANVITIHAILEDQVGQLRDEDLEAKHQELDPDWIEPDNEIYDFVVAGSNHYKDPADFERIITEIDEQPMIPMMTFGRFVGITTIDQVKTDIGLEGMAIDPGYQEEIAQISNEFGAADAEAISLIEEPDLIIKLAEVTSPKERRYGSDPEILAKKLAIVGSDLDLARALKDSVLVNVLRPGVIAGTFNEEQHTLVLDTFAATLNMSPEEVAEEKAGAKSVADWE